MGDILSKPFGSAHNPFRVLVIGLDAAGKTTATYRLKLNETVTTIPSIGFNVETITKSEFTYCLWDVSTNRHTRALLKHYYLNTQGLIFVVDRNDRDRMDEAHELLNYVLEADDPREVPLVIFANKSDLPHSMSDFEILEKLQLHKIENRKWYLQGTNATTGEGLEEGLHKLGILARQFTEEMKLKTESENAASRQPLLHSLHVKLQSLFGSSSVNKTTRVLILGLRGSGKTTLLYKLKLGETVQTDPTQSFNLESVIYNNERFDMWDISSHLELRLSRCKHYLQNTNGLIYVIDSSDKERFDESYEFLKDILNAKELKDIPVVVFANKQDQEKVANNSEIFEALHLREFLNRKWHLQMTSGVTGDGLSEGMNRLAILTNEFNKTKTKEL